ncbi:hypothetical protein ACQPT6_16680 [Erwinia amylovora]|uniref:hypothetical protein n=1 Tax=Erwinia amylovora TaxID=552 RepID=UPI003D056DBA
MNIPDIAQVLFAFNRHYLTLVIAGVLLSSIASVAMHIIRASFYTGYSYEHTGYRPGQTVLA